MIIHDLIQGSHEWLQARLGLPTASCFDQIITPQGKESKQSDGYMNKLLAEMIMGHPADIEKSQWMERGNELEPQAAEFYTFQTEHALEAVGFITDDMGRYGCSPDRLIGEDGLLEIKCPAPWTHIDYLLNEGVAQKYYPQIQGQLFVAERQWCDIISFHPEMSPVIITVNRDEEFIGKLETALNEFTIKMKARKERLMDMGYFETTQQAA